MVTVELAAGSTVVVPVEGSAVGLLPRDGLGALLLAPEDMRIDSGP
jgi:hypothetical protein